MSGRIVSHYRVLAPIGRGGMGTVYEAEDTRLGRRVAVKFLSSSSADDPKAKARFFREARAAANLSHPRVCRVLEVGEDGPDVFLVMEMLEGRTLRAAISGRPMPIPDVLALGAQIAEALEAVHGAGLAHRDLKPSNVFLTPAGVMLTDFGLAKVVHRRDPGPDEATDSAGVEPLTRKGAAVGTVGYMSPEQARGEEVDARTDLFSLGAVLYEMATGRAPFDGATDAVAFEALLARDPPPPGSLNPAVPPALDRVVAKALEKDRAVRYQTAADLRVDLVRAGRAGRAAAPPALEAPPAPGRLGPWPAKAVAAAVLLLLALGGALALRALSESAPPRFTQLTFRRGIVMSARFAPDGRTVVYSALWDGAPPAIFSRRLEDPSSVPLDLPPATLLSVSSRTELAILLAPEGERGTVWLGTLARVPLGGGAVRPVLEGVLDADWSPDGRELAVLRFRDGAFQLEYPVGTTLLRPSPATRLRVSPDGTRVAVLDATGGVILVDRSGHERRLPLVRFQQRLAWAPGGDSLFVDAGDTDLRRSLRRVGLDGEVREALTLPGTLVVHDTAPDGRLLLHHGFERWDVRARAPGETVEREASAFANSGVAGLSADGRRVLLWHHGEGPPGLGLLQSTAGEPPLRIGEGRPLALSADGSAVVLESAGAEGKHLVLVPTGAGESHSVPTEGLGPVTGVWHVDARSVGFDAGREGGPARSYLVAVPGGTPRPLTEDGSVVVAGSVPGRDLLARSEEGSLAVLPAGGGEPRPLPWRLVPDAFREIVRVDDEGRTLFVKEGSVPSRVERIDLETGAREDWMRLGPADATGVGHVWSVQLTPDGAGYAYTHGLFLQDLFLVDGVR